MKQLPILLFTLTCCLCQADPGSLLEKALNIEVIYTEPGLNQQTQLDKKIGLRLADQISQAQSRVQLAAYDLSDSFVTTALLQAHKTGIKVEVVGDHGRFTTPSYQALNKAGIDIVAGNASAIHHNKFLLLDNERLITGTGNFTENGLLRNDNHFLFLDEPVTVARFQKEFEQMFAGQFARSKSANDASQAPLLRSYFLPQQHDVAKDHLLLKIARAQKTIDYMIFSFSDNEIASALIKASARGVRVRGIHDRNFTHGVSQVAARLHGVQPAGLTVRGDGNQNEVVYEDFSAGGKMHCKTMLIDEKSVITGSANWSGNGFDKNDENIMFIENRELLQNLRRQFELAWAKAGPLRFSNNSAEVQVQPGEIIFSEIHWAGSPLSRHDDFVEIYNNSCHVGQCRAIDLSHFVLQFGENDQRNHFAIPVEDNRYYTTDNIIQPGEYKIFYGSTSVWATSNKNDTTPHFRISGSLGFRLESKFVLRIYSPAMQLLDQIDNSVVTAKPSGPQSLQLQGAHWQLAMPGPGH